MLDRERDRDTTSQDSGISQMSVGPGDKLEALEERIEDLNISSHSVKLIKIYFRILLLVYLFSSKTAPPKNKYSTCFRAMLHHYHLPLTNLGNVMVFSTKLCQETQLMEKTASYQKVTF